MSKTRFSSCTRMKIISELFPLSGLVWRDVTRGYHMHQSSIRPGSTAAAVPAIAATAGYSSDEILVERIAAGDKLAMQVLFARHRTPVYRWLLGSSATRPSLKTF